MRDKAMGIPDRSTWKEQVGLQLSNPSGLTLTMRNNKNAHSVPSMPASSYFAIGAGTSFTWMEPERRMVRVVRWIDGDYADAFFGRVLEALDDPG